MSSSRCPSGRSKSATAASFLRPSQPWDQPRSFLAALREKYMPEFHKDEAEVIYISGKEAEEVGFEKFSQRQSKLQGIHVLVLDHMRISNCSSTYVDGENTPIRELCADITELDLGGNLFETIDEIVNLCVLMPKLKGLVLDRNRFNLSQGRSTNPQDGRSSFENIRSLSLANTLLESSETDRIMSVFPRLTTLNLSRNEYFGALELQVPPSLQILDLSDNEMSALSDLRHLDGESLDTLILKRNRISQVGISNFADFALGMTELDISYNAIDSWHFFNYITMTRFSKLEHLRVTGNPLYQSLVSAEGKPLTTEDGYMLTIARLPQLKSLNYAKIPEKERLNSETYYLGQIAIEVSKATEDRAWEVIAKHPRYDQLCADYGEPAIQSRPTQDEIAPNSLAAKLIAITFNYMDNSLLNEPPQSWIEELPKSFDIYVVLGFVAKRLGIMPLRLRLTLETNEIDPLAQANAFDAPEWWDSSDDEAEEQGKAHDSQWAKREVELSAGTRAIGTYVDSRTATIRVAVKP